MRDWITKICPDPDCGEYMLFTPRLVIDTWDCYFCHRQDVIKNTESIALRKQLAELEQEGIRRYLG